MARHECIRYSGAHEVHQVFIIWIGAERPSAGRVVIEDRGFVPDEVDVGDGLGVGDVPTDLSRTSR